MCHHLLPASQRLSPCCCCCRSCCSSPPSVNWLTAVTSCSNKLTPLLLPAACMEHGCTRGRGQIYGPKPRERSTPLSHRSGPPPHTTTSLGSGPHLLCLISLSPAAPHQRPAAPRNQRSCRQGSVLPHSLRAHAGMAPAPAPAPACASAASQAQQPPRGHT